MIKCPECKRDDANFWHGGKYNMCQRCGIFFEVNAYRRRATGRTRTRCMECSQVAVKIAVNKPKRRYNRG